MTLHRRSLSLLLLVLVLALAVATGVGHAATPRSPDEVALSWGDRTFSDPSELSAWLAARGASYGVWAERHPGAAELLEWAAAERARRGVPQGAPFRGVREAEPNAVREPEPVLVALGEQSGLPIWGAAGIAAALLAVGVAGNAAIRRAGRPGLDPITLAVSGAGVTAGIFLVVFATSTRF